MEGRPAAGSWVLMRGLSREQGHWGDFPARMRAAFPGMAVITPDLPGCGARHRERAPATVPGVLADVRREVGAAAGPLWLLGLSLGGMVAYEWMRRHPEELGGVVLVNTSVGGLSPFWRRLRPGAVLAVARAMLNRDVLARERGLFALASTGADRAEEIARVWTALAEAHPVTRLTAVRQLWAAARYRVAPSAAVNPVLVLASAADRMVHPTCSAVVARSLAATLREHPSAGHDLPLDAPAWVIDEVAAWRKSVTGRHTPTREAETQL